MIKALITTENKTNNRANRRLKVCRNVEVCLVLNKVNFKGA
jgi:hypothetical protein